MFWRAAGVEGIGNHKKNTFLVEREVGDGYILELKGGLKL